MRLGVRKSNLLGVAAVAFIAMGAAGCSSLPSVPDWVDPTSWFGDDNASSADNAQTPDLASIPDKPGASTPDDQKQVAESLAADRAHAQYSADALRAGTEPAAPPPPDVAPAPAATAEAELPQPKAVAAPPPVKVASVDRSIAQDPSGSSVPGTLPATAAGTPVAVAAATPATDDTVKTAELPEPPAAPEPAKPQRKTRVAEVAPAPVAGPPPGAQGALPPTPAVPVQTAMINPTDAQLGFKPSSAPPLDPTVSQFVPAQILDRYRQTAAGAGMRPAYRGYAAAAKPRRVAKAASTRGVGGPEKMSGNVTANFEALQTPAPSTAAQAVYADPNGMPATAVVFFPNDTVGLSAEAKVQVEAAAERFKAAGGQGYVRVVGHSSSRTPNMSGAKHIEIIFRKSQDRADAVAQELIRDGVPADKVLVEAVGDSQPVYYESMPKGEDGNRRAEIFLQG